IMGLRAGETFGLQLGDLWDDADGRMRMLVERQRDLRTGALKPWVKADASERVRPVPDILARYLRAYAARYHDGYDFAQPDPTRAGRFLVVTTTGRAPDGTLMAAVPSSFYQELDKCLLDCGLDYDNLGFKLAPHDLRRSTVNYLREIAPRVRAIIAAEVGPAPAADAPVEALEAYLRRRAELQPLLDDAHAVSGGHLSAWIGDGYDGKDEADPVNPVVASNYFRDLPTGPGDDRDPMERIADLLDVVYGAEAPHGLDDHPDEYDVLPVVDPSDPDWLRIDQVVTATGLSDSAVRNRITDGSFTPADKVWFADGDREPPGPRWVIHRSAVDAYRSRVDRLSGLGVEEVLGHNRKAIARLVEAGLLRPDRTGADPMYERGEVAAVLEAVLDVVWEAVAQRERFSIEPVRKQLIGLLKEAPADSPVRVLLAYPSRVGEVQLRYWLGLLAEGGAIKALRDGTWATRDAGKVAEIASARAQERPHFTPGRASQGKGRRRKSPRPNDPDDGLRINGTAKKQPVDHQPTYQSRTGRSPVGRVTGPHLITDAELEAGQVARTPHRPARRSRRAVLDPSLGPAAAADTNGRHNTARSEATIRTSGGPRHTPADETGRSAHADGVDQHSLVTARRSRPPGARRRPSTHPPRYRPTVRHVAPSRPVPRRPRRRQGFWAVAVGSGAGVDELAAVRKEEARAPVDHADDEVAGVDAGVV
ncbi:MAG: hypothetical protein ACLGIZ_18600, partial [Acidimicrobiia bacterium]